MLEFKEKKPGGDELMDPQPLENLLQEFRRGKEHGRLPRGEILRVAGIEGKDAYNPTAPFEIEGKTVLAARVESRKKEGESEIRFLTEQNGVWVPLPDAPRFQLEDPAITRVGDETILSGIRTFPYPDARYSGVLGFQQMFYRGTTLNSLKEFARGPVLMKDIRLLELPDHSIAVFTRPQLPYQPEGGRGKIGFVRIGGLDELNADKIREAEVIESQFIENEWGGANELHYLGNDRIGVLGHISRMSVLGQIARTKEDKRQYCAMAFVYNLATRIASPLKIIAERSDFPAGPAKTAGLKDVVFPGGLVFHEDGAATLWTGLSDAQIGKKEILSPFPPAFSL